jgi:ATP-binding cassette, subfamily F, member 3
VLLAVSDVHKAFATDIILSGASLRLDRRQKAALLGRNGTGKTTLLKILTGQMEPDRGSVQLARGAKIGYLRQEAPVSEGRTVLEEAEEARREQLALKQRLEALELRLEDHPTPEEIEEYATLHEHYLEAEGYAAERDLRTVLLKMGFQEQEFDKPAQALSGGEKTRLALARLLLEQPDLLILDEPTNHLDLQATEWLESWLRGYPGAVLLVSHDRAFLGNFAADLVFDLQGGRIQSYPGPFDKFLKLRQEAEERQAEVAKRQDQQIAKMDEYVRRFMGSERTAQARGRRRHLEKLIASRVSAPKQEKGMKAGFGSAPRSGDIVIECKKLGMGFDGEFLYRNLEWTVRNGERWGVIGENGAGKSTLIRNALGLLDPLEGQARLGSNVVAGYFAQDAVTLDPSQSPLDYLVYDFDLLPAEARNLLGRFLFSGDDVFRPIKTLSGGEKNKLVLAGLTTLNPNLLVLDEPTNHLDMDSREALAEVLQEYKGTLVLISHDRWLLERVTNHTLDVRRDGVRSFPGSYLEYRRRSATKSVPPSPQAKAARSESPESRMTPREVSKEIGRMTKLVAEVEDAISRHEEELRVVEQHLADLPPDVDMLELTKRHTQLQQTLERDLAEWEAHSQRLEQLRQLQA